MLVKATLLKTHVLDELDHRFIFMIDRAFLQLLGHDAQGLGQYVSAGRNVNRSLGAAYDVDDVRRRAFVAECDFSPTPHGDRPPFATQLEAMVDGDDSVDYWVMLAGPFDPRYHQQWHDHDGDYAGVRSPQYRCIGIYEAFRPQEVEEAYSRLMDSPYIPARASATDTRFPDYLAILGGATEDTVVSMGRLDRSLMVWSCICGAFVTPAVINEGHSRYQAMRLPPAEDERGAAALERVYELYGQTHQSRKGPSEHYLLAQPLKHTVQDNGNPDEFGSCGVLLPYAMMFDPYAFSGPASNPGGGPVGEGSGITRLFPFWICDLLARRLYPITASYHDRLVAVAFETIRHLESRNTQALGTFDAKDYRVSSRGRFDFDRNGLFLPPGSTTFQYQLVEDALRCRINDLNLSSRVKDRTVWVVDGSLEDNPYMAWFGMLGRLMLDLPGNSTNPAIITDERLLRRRTILAIASLVRSGDPETPDDREFVTLRTRYDVAEQIAEVCLAQNEEDEVRRILRVRPPLLKTDPDSYRNDPQQKALEVSQAEASIKIRNWRITVVTGDPGTGKSYLQHEVDRFSRELSEISPEGGTYLLVLAPTNRAASRDVEVLGIDRVYLLGGKITGDTIEWDDDDDEGEDARLDFRIGVGTVDSFLRRVEASTKVREAITMRPGIIAIDEAGMLTGEQIAEMLSMMQELESARLASNIIRLVFFGDPYQLPSVDPGDFLGDIMRAVPVAQLREQQRFTGSALEPLFRNVRVSMTDQDRREVVAKYLTALGYGYNDQQCRELIGVEPTREFHPHGLNLGDHEHLKVVLVDDLPSNPETIPSYNRYLARQLRAALFREIMRWSDIEPDRMQYIDPLRCVPVMPNVQTDAAANMSRRARLLGQGGAVEEFRAFRSAFTQPRMPFKVVTMVRRGSSSTGRTDFLSSSERVNGWIHDALVGRFSHVGSDDRSLGALDLTAQVIGRQRDIENYNDGYEQARAAERGQAGSVENYLYSNRPRYLMLCPGWPYVVLRHDFRRYGVFRGETIFYVGTSQGRRGSVKHHFQSESGRHIFAPVRFCTQRHLGYGWAVNVHQIQGGEYPLVIVLWLDGVNPDYVRSIWDDLRPPASYIDQKPDYLNPQIRPYLEYPFRRLRSATIGGRLSPLEDRLDLRAFYTGITRTETVRRQRVVVGGNVRTRESKGRLVLILGKYALRRYQSLEVFNRATPFAGILRQMIGGPDEFLQGA